MRVVGPGGQVGVLERDNESFVINHPDRALTRRIIQVGADETAISAWIGRQLPGVLTRLGLENVLIRPFTHLDRQSDTPGSVLRFIGRWADTAAELGTITAEERQRWFDQLSDKKRGRFPGGGSRTFSSGAASQPRDGEGCPRSDTARHGVSQLLFLEDVRGPDRQSVAV